MIACESVLVFISRFDTQAEVDRTIEIVPEVVKKLRHLSPIVVETARTAASVT